MAVTFRTTADAQQFIQDRLATRAWWIIPVTDVDGMAFVEDMATRFYGGENGVLIDAVMILNPTADVPCLWLVLAAKSCMSPAQLTELTGLPAPEDGLRDILVPRSTPLSVMVWLYSRFNWPVYK